MWTCVLLLIIPGLGSVSTSAIPRENIIAQYREHPAVKKFQQYVRIDTSREENIYDAVEFWRLQADELKLPLAVYNPGEKPVCVITLKGAKPELPSIMLNSHMDVVPVEDNWSHPPFEAVIDENGDLYGRGVQDDKDVSIQYLEAVRRLINENITLDRNIHITLIPDEETGSLQGMIPFLDSEEFKDLNVGFALDEGLSSQDDTFYVMYQDKRPWQLNFTVFGQSNHGSSVSIDSAMNKFYSLMRAIMDYKDTQNKLMESGKPYNNLNVNMVQGGVATNIVPNKVSLVVDIRLSDTANLTEMTELVNSWAAVGGEGTQMTFLRQLNESAATPVDDTNKYWLAIKSAAIDMNLNFVPILCNATSDMIYVRNRNIPAFGFSPKTNTSPHLHSNDEYLNIITFVKGIDIYFELLKRLGNLN